MSISNKIQKHFPGTSCSTGATSLHHTCMCTCGSRQQSQQPDYIRRTRRHRRTTGKHEEGGTGGRTGGRSRHVRAGGHGLGVILCQHTAAFRLRPPRPHADPVSGRTAVSRDHATTSALPTSSCDWTTAGTSNGRVSPPVPAHPMYSFQHLVIAQ